MSTPGSVDHRLIGNRRQPWYRRGRSRTTRSDAASAKIFSLKRRSRGPPTTLSESNALIYPRRRWRSWTKAIGGSQRRLRMPPTSFAIAACRGGFCAAETSIKDHVLEDVCTIKPARRALITAWIGNRRQPCITPGFVRGTTRSDAASAKIFSIETVVARGSKTALSESNATNLSALWTAIVDQSHRKIPTGRSRTPPTSFAIAAGQRVLRCWNIYKDHVLENVGTTSNPPGSLRSPPRSGTGDNAGTVGVVRERPAAMLQS